MPTAEPSQQERTGAMLAAMREAAGLSQRQLARAIGVNHSHLSRVEAGERELGEKYWLAAATMIADHMRESA